MKRRYVTPPDLPAAALDELKDWLAITTTAQDGLLTGLLRSALECCEGFIGQVPLECECEEMVKPAAHWQRLSARPVQSVTALEGVLPDGTRTVHSSAATSIDLDADGGARIYAPRQGGANRLAVRFTAGMSADWVSLPDGLRQGIIRLAAHLYQGRDTASANAAPPAVVAALWRPWRWLYLA